MCVHFCEIKLVLRREKWFSNKAHSVSEQPWMLLCLSKDSAVVKKTDSCSLSTWLSVMSLIIYLVAAMTTLGEVWCMEFLRALSPTTQTVFHQEAALQENPGVKHAKATTAEQRPAWCFDVLFIRRLSTRRGGTKKKKDRLEFTSCFRTPHINSW